MNRDRPEILILRTGHTAPEIITEFGDYDRWFIDRMDGMGCRFSVRHVPDDGVPDARGYDGVLVTGTSSSVLKPEGWMKPLGEFLSAGCGPPVPVLAVCFGAQIVAVALGGRVELNPRGWEIGTVPVDLTVDGRGDPLFDGLTPAFQVQATHEDHIGTLPAGAVLHASNDRSSVQAFAVGRTLRAVQFHPEASAPIIRRLMQIRKRRLEEDALAHGAVDEDDARELVFRIEQGVLDGGDGRRVLETWVRHFVRARREASGGRRG